MPGRNPRLDGLGAGKLLDKCSEFLGAFKRDRVVVAGADATHASVAFETSQTGVGGLFEKLLLSCVDVASL